MKKFNEFIKESDFGIMRALSPYTHRGNYSRALEVLQKLVDRKTQDGKMKHSPEYYAGVVARQYSGVDARKLADMLTMSESEMVLEGKSDYILYHDSASDAAQEAYAFAERNGYVVDDEDWFRVVTNGAGRLRPSPGKTSRRTVSLFKRKGSDVVETRQKLHFQIYAMDGGSEKYELTVYVS
jgi:hypothetical protein